MTRRLFLNCVKSFLTNIPRHDDYHLKIEEADAKGELHELVLMIIWKRLDLAHRDDSIRSLDLLSRRAERLPPAT
uniref:Uncharacterized protein n=1 Tax=Brassica oleracea TaxID=3712 RepID=A0A3P6GKI3_BRAOL|nr:unnamed protein product [Brassica oleracea]